MPPPLTSTNQTYGFTETTVTTTTRVPNPAPTPALRWTIGPVKPRSSPPGPQTTRPPTTPEDFTVQLTADQQCDLGVAATDRYGNPVTLTGDTTWSTSDPSILTVTQHDDDPAAATVAAAGPAGTASVTVTSDPDSDTGTPNFQGSLAVDVVAGDITELVITAGTPTDKP